MDVTVYRSLDDVEDAWRDFQKVADCWPFQSFDFVSAWERTIGRAHGTDLCIVLVHDAQGSPLMLLPLERRRRGPFRIVCWTGGPMADYKAPLIAPRLSERVDYESFDKTWRTIRSALPAHDVVQFSSQPRLIGDQRNPFVLLSGSHHPSSSHYTELADNYDEFLKDRRSSKSRWRLRRKLTQLEEMGEVEFVVPTEDADIESVLGAIFEQKSRSYREMGVRDLFATPEYREFCLTLAKESRGEGLAHLSALTLDGEVVAGHWGLVFRKRFYFLFPSYAEGEVERVSPGVSLLQHLFQWSIDHGVEEFDFTVGDEAYKDRWCNRELELYDYVEASSITGLAPAVVNEASRRLKRTIKTSDTLWPIATRVRSLLGQPLSVLRSR